MTKKCRKITTKNYDKKNAEKNAKKLRQKKCRKKCRKNDLVPSTILVNSEELV